MHMYSFYAFHTPKVTLLVARLIEYLIHLYEELMLKLILGQFLLHLFLKDKIRVLSNESFMLNSKQKNRKYREKICY